MDHAEVVIWRAGGGVHWLEDGDGERRGVVRGLALRGGRFWFVERAGRECGGEVEVKTGIGEPLWGDSVPEVFPVGKTGVERIGPGP